MKASDRNLIVGLARRQGWRIKKGKGGHGILLRPPNGPTLALRTHGSQGLRDEPNLVAALRRAGLQGLDGRQLL